jgi:hypothetical protein
MRNPELKSREQQPLLRALYSAYPDRLARRRNPGGEKGVMIGGRGVRLAPTSGVTDGELFVCVDIDAGQTESLVRMASRVERDWLPSDQIVEKVEVYFDEKSERVVSRRCPFAASSIRTTWLGAFCPLQRWSDSMRCDRPTIRRRDDFSSDCDACADGCRN